jgi:hypothetical protein
MEELISTEQTLGGREIYEALSAFLAECPTIEKKTKAHFGLYADLSDIIGKIRPLLAKYGLFVYQAIETLPEGTYITTKILHKSGQAISSSYLIDYKAPNAQEMGKLISYFRRYTLSAALMIVSDDDIDDEAKGEPEKKYQKKEKKISASQMNQIRSCLNGNKELTQQIMNLYKIKNADEILEKDFKDVMNLIEIGNGGKNED